MAASVSYSPFSAYNSNSLKTMNRQWDKRKWNQNKNRNKTEYEEEWRGTKMEDGKDVKNQRQLFVAKMTADNLKKKQKRIRRETKRNQQQLLEQKWEKIIFWKKEITKKMTHLFFNTEPVLM